MKINTTHFIAPCGPFDLPFGMVQEEIVAFDFVCGSLVADIIEACKACAVNVADSVIRHQKMLLPAHINKVFFVGIVDKLVVVKYVDVGLEGREAFLKDNVRRKQSKPKAVKPTQWDTSMLCCACHFRVRNEYLGPIISAWKKVYSFFISF